jgi:hypothetical protein
MHIRGRGPREGSSAVMIAALPLATHRSEEDGEGRHAGMR